MTESTTEVTFLARFATIIFVVGMLTTGTVNTITKKIQNESSTQGIHQVHTFSHPWFVKLKLKYSNPYQGSKLPSCFWENLPV
jgi:hypothetical protein